MAILLWVLVLALLAAGSAWLICYMMRCTMEEAVAKERGALVELRAALKVQKKRLERAISDARAQAKREAFDEYFDDLKVEQQYYVRKSSLFFMSRKTLVLRERIMFRNLPLTKWVEQPMTLEENAGAGYIGKGVAIEASLAPLTPELR
jgi:hypothetical protein